MVQTAGIDARWYAPLLRPVYSTVTRALDLVALERDPWTLPRTGLGGALVIQVSRGFGLRAGRRAERAAIATLEGYNHRLHLGLPDTDERARLLSRDLQWARRAWASLLEYDEATVTRVLDRLFGPTHHACDRQIPEAVLFLRAAVAVGVVLGGVPDAVHDVLDRHVTWVGLSWEAHRGTLDAPGWGGALAAIGLQADYPADPEPRAREQAIIALAELPQRSPVDLLSCALSRAPSELPIARHPQAWTPLAAPTLPSTSPSRVLGGGGLGEFGRRWQPEVEQALGALTHSGSEVLTRATAYLRSQGGKRVRPLITLAAAEACGGDARRVLSLAAAIEWLHQGTLVLDDIVDAASLRRGHAALHTATSDVFATGIAVFVFTRVLRCSQGMHPDIRRHVINTATALADGERLELEHTGDPSLSLTRYYEIIEAKTARLFGCAAALGALGVEAPAVQVKALVRFGRELGLAFQIIDDLLDYLGDAAALGKRPGTDLRAGKMTLPTIVLRERLQGDERQRLADALGREHELEWVQAKLAQHDVAQHCHARVRSHSGRAQQALQALPPGPARDTIASFAHELGGRQC
ncbi:Octaprenyl diphosphate synthase [Enhygromyxa salina]|uniref:Octaprenyl diphosphate synthase n=1 Tax=Enhygromyxa salina TaxID=215803 RepID=A0A0C2CWE7_9BACT|nr:polyprenyl synthetase family protein [Enhygromyxa salina]KIG12177.1 Octaprenyl diphosphate synthase [Enhygromyxa salina]